MARVFLELRPDLYRAVWAHLLPRPWIVEEAAFVFAAHKEVGGRHLMSGLDWYPVRPGGFESRSAYHLELTTETQAGVLKRAHDLGASLVELHSHSGAGLPRFSESDLWGFEEFVPHAWWRLKRRPYAAIVAGCSGFDGLAWVDAADRPEPLAGINVGSELLTPRLATPRRAPR